MIFDWDVHHGNGTQEIYYHNKSVLYISIHRYDNGTFFPHTAEESDMTAVGSHGAEGFNVNIPWSGVRNIFNTCSSIITCIFYNFNFLFSEPYE